MKSNKLHAQVASDKQPMLDLPAAIPTPAERTAQFSSDNQPLPGWRLLRQGLQVRLRFALAIAALGVLMAIWPWLRGAWETAIAKWSSSDIEQAVSADTEFYCPMDPGFNSAWPAICPICNMDLQPRKKADAVILPEGVVARMQITPYRVQLAGIRTVPVRELTIGENPDAQQVLQVPITAVVSRGAERVVYVEAMPGMFDGVSVSLGARDGDFYRVDSGLQLGQRVVATGAFLLDAESRLNPWLSNLFWGASGQLESSRQTPKAKRPSSSNEPAQVLSKADQELVKLQLFCPVTKELLGSMGTPTFVSVKDRRIALCCRSCEVELLKDPAPYLGWLVKVLAAYNAPAVK